MNRLNNFKIEYDYLYQSNSNIALVFLIDTQERVVLMFNIDKYSNISITKYNSGVVSVEPIIDSTGQSYELQDGDIVIFSVKTSCNDIIQPVLQKTYTKEECTDCESDTSTTEITLSIEPEDTANLDYYDYVYDVAIQTTDGGFYTFIGGGEKPLRFRVLPSISQPKES